MAGPAQSIPTTELVGPMGKRIVNTCDVGYWLKRGYSVPVEGKAVAAPAEAAPPTETEAASEDEGTSTDEVLTMTKKELVAFIKAKELDVDIPKGAKLADIREIVIDALDAEE